MSCCLKNLSWIKSALAIIMLQILNKMSSICANLIFFKDLKSEWNQILLLICPQHIAILNPCMFIYWNKKFALVIFNQILSICFCVWSGVFFLMMSVCPRPSHCFHVRRNDAQNESFAPTQYSVSVRTASTYNNKSLQNFWNTHLNLIKSVKFASTCFF